MVRLLIATTEQGKINEVKDILGNLGFVLVSLGDIQFPPEEPLENGLDFETNAIFKAQFYGAKSKMWTLTDDSGLIVDALPGKLGVRSKRYKVGSDKERYRQLLADLKNIPKSKRTARFVSVVALYNPVTEKITTAQGICEGEIALNPAGNRGFGYDPVFLVKDLNKHFAQLTLKEKNQVSHRGKALRKIKPYLVLN